MKLSDLDVERIFEELALPEGGRAMVRTIRAGVPARHVSTAGSVSGRFVSEKMEMTIQSESRSGEGVACLEYETSTEVLEFYDQPTLLTVEYQAPGSMRPTIQHTPDFLVIRRPNRTRPLHEIVFEEWRQPDRMRALAATDPGRWRELPSGDWTQVPIEQELAQFGLGYRIRMIGSIPVILARNWALLQDFYLAPHALAPETVERALDQTLRQPGLSLPDLLRRTDGLTVDDVFALIAQNSLQANLTETLLTEHDRVRLSVDGPLAQVLPEGPTLVDRGELVLEPDQHIRFVDRDMRITAVSPSHVFLSDDRGTEKLRRADFDRFVSEGDIVGLVDTRPDVIGKLLNRDPEDREAAQQRLKVLEAYKDGGTRPRDRTHQRWAAAFHEAELQWGEGNGLIGLLPELEAAGNRKPRLAEDTELLAAEAIKRYLLTPDQLSIRTAYKLYRVDCEQAKPPVEPMGQSAFFERVKHVRQSDYARGRWGKRAGYAAALRGPVNGLPIHGDHAFGRVHIDHSPTDLETVDSVTGDNLGIPYLTLAVDASTHAILAAVVLYEPPSARSVQLALREMVRTHHRLPGTMVIDNGAEFHGKGVQTLCAARGTNIEYRRSGDARDGGPVESGLRQVMVDMLWNLRGNTKIRKNVRRMDRDNDPAKRAVWTYAALSEQLQEYVRLHNDRVVPALGGSPNQLIARSFAAAGARPGRTQTYSVGFRAISALEPRRGGLAKVARDGVRIQNLQYWGECFRMEGVAGSKVAVRYEPFDARTAYALVNGVWHVIHAAYPELEGRTDKEIAAVSVELRRRLGRSPSDREMAEYIHRMKEREVDLSEQQRKRLQQREAQSTVLAANDHRSPNPQDGPAAVDVADPAQDVALEPDLRSSDDLEVLGADQLPDDDPAIASDDDGGRDILAYEEPTEAEVRALMAELAQTEAAS